MNKSTNIKIKIDTGTIPVLVENKKVLKLYSFYLVLKAYDQNNSGTIDYLSNIKELCSIMNISQRTFYNRLNACLLIDIIYRKNDTIKLVSYHKAANYFNLNHSGNLIEIDPTDQAIEYKIRTKAIELNLIDQRKVVHKKITENYKGLLMNPEQIRLQLCSLLIAAFVTGTPEPFLPSNLNPDITVSTKQTSKMFGCKNQSSGVYWQKTLLKRGCLEMEQRKITSEARTNKTKLIGFLSWNPKTKSKFLNLRNIINPL